MELGDLPQKILVAGIATIMVAILAIMELGDLLVFLLINTKKTKRSQSSL